MVKFIFNIIKSCLSPILHNRKFLLAPGFIISTATVQLSEVWIAFRWLPVSSLNWKKKSGNPIEAMQRVSQKLSLIRTVSIPILLNFCLEEARRQCLDFSLSRNWEEQDATFFSCSQPTRSGLWLLTAALVCSLSNLCWKDTTFILSSALLPPPTHCCCDRRFP